MARIVIFEDNILETNLRYGTLVPQNDVHIFMESTHFEGAKLFLARRGFTASQIYSRLPGKGEEIMDADIYFVDDLEGSCMEFTDKLPKGRTFLVSRKPWIEQRWVDAGYNIASEKEVPEIVAKLSE